MLVDEMVDDTTKPIRIGPAVITEISMDHWRWCTKNSDGWQLVSNEDHARELINEVDHLWPWLMIERSTPKKQVLTHIASCGYGLVLEATVPKGDLARIYHKSRQIPRRLPVEEKDVPIREVLADELFSKKEADAICLRWIKEETLPRGFGLRLPKIEF